MLKKYEYANAAVFFAIDHPCCERRLENQMSKAPASFRFSLGWEETKTKFYLSERAVYENELPYVRNESMHSFVEAGEDLISVTQRLAPFENVEIEQVGIGGKMQKDRLLSKTQEGWKTFCAEESILWHCYRGKLKVFALHQYEFPEGKFFKSQYMENRRCPIQPKKYVLDEYEFQAEDFLTPEQFKLFTPITVKCDGVARNGIVYGSTVEWFGSDIARISVFVLRRQKM